MNPWLVFAALGATAGLLAGMFGIGGGVVLVPVFHYLFKDMAPGYSMHLAVATSSACIVLSTIASVLTHHQKGAVKWKSVLYFLPGIVVGAGAGSVVASHFPGWILTAIFAVFELYFATDVLFSNPRQQPSTSSDFSFLRIFPVALLIGMLSAFVGIGGGSLMVPVLMRYGEPFVRAIGTSSALGLAISAASALGYAFAGQGIALPSPRLGFIYLPAFLGAGVFALLAAPFGARLVHAIPAKQGRRLFACLLYLVGFDMLRELAGHFLQP